MFHLQAFRPTPPDSITAIFDSVLRRDSTLFPALIHPLDLALMYRNRAAYDRYFPRFERTAPHRQVSAVRTAAARLLRETPTAQPQLITIGKPDVSALEAARTIVDFARTKASP